MSPKGRWAREKALSVSRGSQQPQQAALSAESQSSSPCSLGSCIFTGANSPRFNSTRKYAVAPKLEKTTGPRSHFPPPHLTQLQSYKAERVLFHCYKGPFSPRKREAHGSTTGNPFTELRENLFSNRWRRSYFSCTGWYTTEITLAGNPYCGSAGLTTAEG